MSTEPNNLKKIFGEALAKASPEEREQYLANACSHDLSLRQQVDSLLLANAESGDFLQQRIVPSNTPPIGEGPGGIIGRYKLLQQIGEGGFGVVFMAEQQEPVRRMVALKIIKAGMDTREVVARFEAERQALALMDHPNIARVLDGGATEGGRPYFVMDLVKGVPITEFCDQRCLPTEARLRLFMQVCAAVQHAHQKGVIHRDMKPNNVLVTLHDGDPVPKVIDFGISKAIGHRLTDKTLFTRFEQLMGTPAYMSPEQAEWSGLDIDTRSDIYSLGVLLYELLTGTTPLEKETLSRAAIDEMRRMIRETDPERPSARLSRLSSIHNLNPNPTTAPTAGTSLKSQIHSDLDWVVMKSLDKNRTRRYETVSAFARDIERHLQCEPVTACPPSAIYRARKFVRKHRVGVAVGTVITISLVFGLLLALVGFARAQQESKRAQEQAANAKAVDDFLENDFLRQADRWSNPDRDIKLRAVLDRASGKIAGRFADQPIVEASIRRTIGETYLELGELDAAEPQIKRALEIRTHKLGSEHPDTLQILYDLARLYTSRGMYGDAEKMLLQVSAAYRRIFGPEHASTLDAAAALAENYLSWERVDRAEDVLRDLLPKLQRVFGPENLRTLRATKSMSEVYFYSGRYHDAAEWYQKALNDCRRVLGPENPLTLEVMTQLGSTYRATGDYAQASDLLTESLELKRRVNGPRHPETISAYKSLADICGRTGSWQKCLELCLEISRSAADREDFRLRGGAIALLLGNTNAYREFTALEIAQFGQTTDPDQARLITELCFLCPDPLSDMVPMFRLANLVRTNSTFPWDRVAREIAEYRKGNFSAALSWFERARKCANDTALSQANYFRAMAYYRQGNSAAAQAALSDAETTLQSFLRGGQLGHDWHEYVRVAVARNEAEKLIFGRQLQPSIDSAWLQNASKSWEPVRRHLEQADRLSLERRWSQARDECLAAMRSPLFNMEAVDRNAGKVSSISKMGVTFLLAKDHDAYQQLLRPEFSHAEECPDPLRTWRVIRTYLLGEAGAGDENGISAVQAVAALTDTGGTGGDEVSLVRTITAYRYARFAEVRRQSNAAEHSNRLSLRAAARILSAMALAKLGGVEEGKKELAQAEADLGGHLRTLTGDLWWDLAMCQLLLDEAHRLFAEKK